MAWLVTGGPSGHRRYVTSAITGRATRLRKSMTGTELRIWIRIRGRRMDGWKFRRQHPIGPFVVDFYCPAARLVVEVDGPIHEFEENWAYDMRRQAWLENKGYRVLRIPHHWIDEDIESATETIRVTLDEQAARGCQAPPALHGATSP